MTNKSIRKTPFEGARVYLSGPMDFVASRDEEMKYGWRNRVSQFLKKMGVTVFDPWHKPGVKWFAGYGIESPSGHSYCKENWSFDPGKQGYKARAQCAKEFWKTVHIDLRMVDTSDFLISYCPTNIYSVGTVHEIITARNQHKPVLFVSPHIPLHELADLCEHLKNDEKGLDLLNKLRKRDPIQPNLEAIPSLWYMPIVEGHNFFDGFGFAQFNKEFKWTTGPMDFAEKEYPPKRPLLPFLRSILKRKPKYFSLSQDKLKVDDDWLLWDLK